MDPAEDHDHLIQLHQMPQRSEARSRTEDWTGVTSTSQRRKLQNRLNQRARRRRNAEVTSQKASTEAVGEELAPAVVLSWDPITTKSSISIQSDQAIGVAECTQNNFERQVMYRRFAEQAYTEYTNGVLQLQQLPALLGVNLFYAMAHNAAKLGVYEEWMFCDSISPFCQQGPGLGPMRIDALAPSLSPCSGALLPTDLQLSVSHHPWIDLFPFPRFRDNVLSAIEVSEDFEDELCMDSVEISDCCGSDSAFLIVWGEPSDPRGWEVGPTLFRKWSWLLEGCDEMLEATNYWRERRGEKRLIL